MGWTVKLRWLAQSVCLDEDTRNDVIFHAIWIDSPLSVMEPIDGFSVSWMPQRCLTEAEL